MAAQQIIAHVLDQLGQGRVGFQGLDPLLDPFLDPMDGQLDVSDWLIDERGFTR